jgi:pyruvate dehydrogenase E2 component (dihydrolipoamide acetyltransferase)
MEREIVMPQMGVLMTEGVVCRWLKAVGDHVKKGEPLFEVETDKATSEVEAEAAGTIDRILVPEGGTARVGEAVALLRTD